MGGMADRQEDDELDAALRRAGKAALAKDAVGNKLIDNLIHSLLDYDIAYEDVMVEWPKSVVTNKPEGMTEERLKIATRNKMRERTQEFPEIARWRLRVALGFRSEEE